MMEYKHQNGLILGCCLIIGLTIFGFLLSDAVVRFKEFERSVTAKGLSEREVEADTVVWPIRFTAAGNDITDLYNSMESSTAAINAFLTDRGIQKEEISFSSPAITDRLAQQYGGNNKTEFRYTAHQTVTVYSNNVKAARKLMRSISALGKKGIVFSGSNYDSQTEYLFTRLNDLKPEMIEEATKNARKVAQKFAADSESSLGKIKKASQGQFSIKPRDKNTPHIKKIRVVSTVEYYLAD